MIPKFNNEEEAEKFFGQNNDDEAAGDDEEMTIIELEGERYEVIDSVIYDGKLYVAILPYDEENIDENNDEDENIEFTILEVCDDPDDEDNCIMRTVDDDDLYTKIGNEFLKRFESESDEEE